jgi:hypothetical protein
MGAPDCALPSLGIDWHPTRPPVVMDCWSAGASNRAAGDADGKPAWTTVMTWNNFQRPILHQGRRYGTKELEFPRFQALPSLVRGVPLEMAVGGDPPIERWRQHGWRFVDSHEISTTPERYREYILASRGEWSVAKNVYVATRSGWFSCRSVCYLAAGRPVVVQDTGFSEVVPVGRGLHAFSTPEEAADALLSVEAAYDRESRGALEIAREHFASEVVLSRLLDTIGFA